MKWNGYLHKGNYIQVGQQLHANESESWQKEYKVASCRRRWRLPSLDVPRVSPRGLEISYKNHEEERCLGEERGRPLYQQPRGKVRTLLCSVLAASVACIVGWLCVDTRKAATFRQSSWINAWICKAATIYRGKWQAVNSDEALKWGCRG